MKKFTLFAILSLLLAACSKDDTAEPAKEPVNPLLGKAYRWLYDNPPASILYDSQTATMYFDRSDTMTYIRRDFFKKGDSKEHIPEKYLYKYSETDNILKIIAPWDTNSPGIYEYHIDSLVRIPKGPNYNYYLVK